MIAFGTRHVGPDQPPFHLADTGTTHDGDLQMGYRLIETSGAAGAAGVVVARGTLNERDFKCILGHAGHIGLPVLGAPENMADVALLGTMDVAGVRLPNAEDVPPPLLRRVASMGRPLLVSMREPDLQVAQGILTACRECGAQDLAFLVPDPRMMKAWQVALPGVAVGLFGGEFSREQLLAFHVYLIEAEHRLPAPTDSRRHRP